MMTNSVQWKESGILKDKETLSKFMDYKHHLMFWPQFVHFMWNYRLQ